MLIDVLKDTLIDSLKLIPFLFLTYLVMEYLEHKTGEKSRAVIQKTGKYGPLIGGIIGIIPQCGFSAAAASLFAGGILSAGTLLAIFLSTSDEMLPIFISESVAPVTIFRILGMKILLGAVSGFLIDFFQRLPKKTRRQEKNGHMHEEKDIHSLCEHEHCHCEEEGIFKSAVIHTVQITLFIFVISLAIGLAVELVGQERIGSIASSRPVAGVFLAALIGLIPNCASSVAISQLYLNGILGSGQMMAGLLVGAGVGLLVLFRTNKNVRENLKITGMLYALGVFWGILIEVTGVVF
ncbi:putative manganese transporter [Novisyntrophococcus fermenticellae]|uniref:putative manganese transporter n=1 Tax=Novisyntrophococcus fermenticellae TaxID=2068655 RepID=UPI001E49CF06|nr:putative manganese transporter [Novisyntrophococcus fermenticellae]